MGCEKSGRVMRRGTTRVNADLTARRLFYLFGGLVGTFNSATPTTSVMRLVVTDASPAWTEVAALSTARYGMGAAFAPVTSAGTGLMYIPTGCTASSVSLMTYPPVGISSPNGANEYRSNASSATTTSNASFTGRCGGTAAVLNGMRSAPPAAHRIPFLTTAGCLV